jgi:hypothetical protein
MIAIIINNEGIRTLATFPIPSLRSLCEINHKIAQIKIVPIAVGISKVQALARLELPPTKPVKKVVGFAPQENLKLDRKYTISQLMMTI